MIIDEATPRASARIWCGLGVLLLAALLASMDVSILFVAGPTISEQLSLTPAQWLWVMDTYGIVMAGLLITMGCLGDRIGRRRLLMIGAGLFGAASALIGLAPNGELLILGRAVLAVGGATLAPSTLSLIRTMFERQDQRRAALGAWTVTFTTGAICGPILGGVLLEHWWWGSVFLINIPPMVLLLIAAPLLVPESARNRQARLDLFGAAASFVAVLGPILALKSTIETGPSVVTAASAAVGVAALIIFISWQRRARHALLNLSLFRSRRFSVGIAANTTVAAITGGVGVLVFPYLQTVHGLSPLASALCGLPPMAGSFLGAATATALARRHSPTALLVIGMVTCASGLAIAGATASASTAWGFLGGYTLLIAGCGATATLANSFVLDNAPHERAGAVAGISETSNQLGTAVGIALLGTLASIVYRHELTGREPPTRSVTEASVIASTLPGDRAAELLGAAAAAYNNGLALSAFTAAALAAVLAVIIGLLLFTGDRYGSR
ncbi:MFS transporter [Microlunatus parietis]|uniref:DHA2 family multidrug resistance protein-like MFS transporter n=1 Tax=Microlunatus parietis TaxID=682979 RepID=A0A7Y9I4U5_9ACTN|nr:MFS transporter [Microlunatus parietis]NYE70056.1 DHA2 family multidrug resistance protein-like MFS transporter [Microlunatus parietis]